MEEESWKLKFNLVRTVELEPKLFQNSPTRIKLNASNRKSNKISFSTSTTPSNTLSRNLKVPLNSPLSSEESRKL